MPPEAGPRQVAWPLETAALPPRHCERSEAIHSAASGEVDCFASLAMTAERAYAFSRRNTPEVCYSPCPLCQRAQGRPGARRTRGLACQCTRQKRTRAYRFGGNTPAFPAQWLYGLLRALPGERLSCHRRPMRSFASQDLTPAPRRQNHTTSPYASATHVSRSSRVHRISPRVRDDGQRPSSAVRRAELCR